MRQFVKSRTSIGEAPGGGRLNLVLSGFHRQEIVPVEHIVQAIDRIPSFHLQGLREILYLPEYAPAARPLACHGGFGGEPKGEFVQRERRIFVYRVDRPALFFQMLHHEVGHFVFFLVIGSHAKKRWVTEISPGSRGVTAYADVNPWEDFAESYAYYLLHPHVLQEKLPQKHAFMRECVFIR